MKDKKLRSGLLRSTTTNKIPESHVDSIHPVILSFLIGFMLGLGFAWKN